MNWWRRWINLWMPSSVRLQGVWMVVLQIGTWVKLKIINGLMPGSKWDRRMKGRNILCYEMSFVSSFSVQNLRVNLRIRGLFLQHILPEIWKKTDGFKWFQIQSPCWIWGRFPRRRLGIEKIEFRIRFHRNSWSSISYPMAPRRCPNLE